MDGENDRVKIVVNFPVTNEKLTEKTVSDILCYKQIDILPLLHVMIELHKIRLEK